MASIADQERWLKVLVFGLFCFSPDLHDPDVVCLVDLGVLLQLLAQRGHGALQVLLLATELLLDVRVHAG